MVSEIFISKIIGISSLHHFTVAGSSKAVGSEGGGTKYALFITLCARYAPKENNTVISPFGALRQLENEVGIWNEPRTNATQIELR